MNDPQMEVHTRFTLVSYTPEPLAHWLTQLRRLLSVTATSQPHITILPPRPLNMPVAVAKRKIRSLLAGWYKFDVELSDLRVFPSSSVLYLDVNDGSNSLRRLHSELNSGNFAHEEVFEFHPHVTLGGPVAPENLESVYRKAAEAWNSARCSARFTIEEVVFVSIATSGCNGEWRRMWAQSLGTEKKHQLAARAAVTNQTF